ncbi:hypothetical protein BDZ45DRAFT_335521 [Acephala macrosclerotiorum]|nr:hypothetical protein BDZ45DRAFT_335521 [Acephala macrosclerotiorum]
MAGEPTTIPFPCGVNCSYTIEFEGPWFECNTIENVAYLDWTDFSNTTGAVAYNATYGSTPITRGGYYGAAITRRISIKRALCILQGYKTI